LDSLCGAWNVREARQQLNRADGRARRFGMPGMCRGRQWLSNDIDAIAQARGRNASSDIPGAMAVQTR